MSQHIQHYIALLEHGTPCKLDAPAISPIEAARLFVTHTHKHGPLPLLGAWRLHPAHARLLERSSGGAPAGGWAALAAVLAGTPLVQITDEGFIATTSPERLDLWTPGMIQRAIIEALTCRMAPPVTAAGLFILMGINPIAGLHLARSIHDGLAPWSSQPSSERTAALGQQLAQDPMLHPLRESFFGALAIMLELLRSLSPDHMYPVDALANLVMSVCCSQRELLWQLAPPAQRAQLFSSDMHLFDEDGMRERALDFATLDLLDGYLVPAGLARRLEGGMFAPCPDALRADFDIVGVDPSERTMWLTRFLTHDARELCA
jgi:hypothetical protein